MRAQREPEHLFSRRLATRTSNADYRAFELSSIPTSNLLKRMLGVVHGDQRGTVRLLLFEFDGSFMMNNNRAGTTLDGKIDEIMTIETRSSESVKRFL
jgi:hypothetical protein